MGRSIPLIHNKTQAIQTDPYGSPRVDPYTNFDAATTFVAGETCCGNESKHYTDGGMVFRRTR